MKLRLTLAEVRRWIEELRHWKRALLPGLLLIGLAGCGGTTEPEQEPEPVREEIFIEVQAITVTVSVLVIDDTFTIEAFGVSSGNVFVRVHSVQVSTDGTSWPCSVGEVEARITPLVVLFSGGSPVAAGPFDVSMGCDSPSIERTIIIPQAPTVAINNRRTL